MLKFAKPERRRVVKQRERRHKQLTRAQVRQIVYRRGPLVFAFNFLYSLFFGAKAERNPWHANTLEWEAPTPVPHGNFPKIPHVYRGPYEYSVPGEKEDYLPQAQPGGRAAAAH